MTKVEKSSNRSSRPGERRGGRKAGTPNKKTAAVIKAVEAGGIMPLDYMLGVMRDPDAELVARNDMAKAAAPYTHPRLAAIEVTGKGGAPVDMNWTVTLVRPGKHAGRDQA